MSYSPADTSVFPIHNQKPSGLTGVEPASSDLEGRCSANELQPAGHPQVYPTPRGTPNSSKPVSFPRQLRVYPNG